MKTVPLKLVHAVDGSFQPAAWFIPGDDSGAWLDELLRWHVDLTSVRLLVVPAAVESAGEQAAANAAGVLVTEIDGRPRASIAQPYRKIGSRLFAPLESRLDPAVSDRELDALLESSSIVAYVWHPVAGLIGYEASDRLTVDRLLTMPKRTSADWSAAVPGVRLSPRLISIEPIVALTIRDILEDGRDDIGSESTLDDAPRSPDETPLAGLQDAGRSLIKPLAYAAKWFTDHTPATANQRTWINSLGDWANRFIQQGMASQARRNNEIKRLMHMLESDPDKGLRYAIPFGGDAHRGVGTPSDQLVSRNVDFGFGGGGGPADFWSIPPDYQARLHAQYSQLAIRETRLGRYRRAAYIYAELMGDYLSAARTLEQGRHFREAATLYKDRLGQPRKAAECLRDAGLFSEAISAFEKLGDWEEIARLHEQLGNPEAAIDAWQRAATKCEEGNDYLHAAEIFDKHLKDQSSAIECLESGWDRSHQSEVCLKTLFQMLGQVEDHDGAKERVDRLCLSLHQPLNKQIQAATLLANLSHDYPNKTIRNYAADTTRQLVARNLETRAASGTLLAALQRLAPEDRLLSRDCNRFTQKVNSKRARRPSRNGQIQCEKRVFLDKEIEWEAVTTDGMKIFAAGFGEKANHTALMIAAWNPGKPDAPIEYTHWYWPGNERPRIQLAVRSQSDRPVMIHLFGAQFKKDFTRKTSFPGTSVMNSVLPGSTLAFATRPDGSIPCINYDRGNLHLMNLSLTGIPQAVHALSVRSNEETPFDPILSETGIACTDSQICVAIGQQLFVLDTASSTFSVAASDVALVASESFAEAPIEEIELPHQARGICCSGNASESRVAVTFEDGGMVQWLRCGEQRMFGHGLVNPIAEFTPQGHLIAVDEHGAIEIYDTRKKTLQLVASATSRDVRPVGLVTHFDRFCIIYEDGAIDLQRNIAFASTPSV
ncbi:MAG: tetratricopeptide (TPR) repeat protein [Planctomycetaceae bacterium]|jgi:tetratricopeptide (TPR) repeat protein